MDDEKTIDAHKSQPENQLWRRAKNRNRPKKFETPEELFEACCEYFEWCEANPELEEKVFGTGFRTTIARKRPFLLTGMCVHMGISNRTWYYYTTYEGFEDVCETVAGIIREQKFSGAAVGLFNHLIVARELGLADKSEISGPEGAPIEVAEISAAEKLGDFLAKKSSG